MVLAFVHFCIWKMRFFRNIQDFQFGIVVLTISGIIALVYVIDFAVNQFRNRDKL